MAPVPVVLALVTTGAAAFFAAHRAVAASDKALRFSALMVRFLVVDFLVLGADGSDVTSVVSMVAILTLNPLNGRKKGATAVC